MNEELSKIPSFRINHEKLLRGIYVSRKDKVGNEVITTFDIRMKEPNREPVLHVGAIHTIEHLAATFLRNDKEWKDRVIYWGPMGCLTGNYLLLRGDLVPEDIVDLMRRTFQFIADYEGEIPGAAPRDCGNYLLHDLPMARWEARKFLNEVLLKIQPENMVYPE
ncbi:MAG: S-ribosylhomocysteine lyase [Prevotella sp.]|jgi:S-ribosylhomocysteine lyase